MNLETLFKSLVKSIIDRNQAFYGIADEIEYVFEENKDLNIVATCGDDFKIKVNSLALKKLLDDNEMDKIEFYLLVAIRQLFQLYEISVYEDGYETITGKDIVEKWIEEKKNLNYDENDSKFFDQVTMLDAYSFAYAVMKFKYQDVACLEHKFFETDLFKEIVNDWIEEFKEEIDEIDPNEE